MTPMSTPTPPAPSRDQAAHAPPSLQGLRVLLADDQVINVMILRKLLTQLGCSLERVENGEQAIERWQQGHFDLILMDLQMPVLGGLEATRRIRELERTGTGARTGHVPIVAVTASGLEQDRERCLAADMDAHLARPVALEQLEQALRSALCRAGSGRQVQPAEAVPTTPPLALDLALDLDLEQLRSNLDHDQELLREFATAMRREMQQRLQRLQQAAQAADTAQACAQAHALRGGLGCVGAAPAVTLTRALEHSAAAGDWNRFQQELAQLQPWLQAIESALAVHG